MKILLVEDDKDISQYIETALRSSGHVVDVFRNGQDALLIGLQERFDVAIIDRMLPGLDGLSLLRGLRGAGAKVPVIFLTSMGGVHDRVEGLEAGADDYLTKPFRTEELIMRLRALVRRAAGHAQTKVVCGPLCFDAQIGTFELDGLPLKLTALEWRVLSSLMLRKEVVVSRLDLLERVYEGDVEVESNSLEVIIARLRRKIGHAHIETTRGLGYRLTAGLQ